jgi:hypothetical protein
MKYTKENMKGIGVRTDNSHQSYKIVQKFISMGIDPNGNAGTASHGAYGFRRNNILEGLSSIHEFKSIISFEEFMNEDEDKIIDSYEIY